VKSKNEKVKKILEELQAVSQRLRELARDMSLETGEKTYEAAGREMDGYLSSLQELELRYKDYVNSRSLMQQYSRRRSEAAEDADELQGELYKSLMLLKQVRKQLEEMGAEEIRERIGQVIKRLNEIPGQLLNLQDQLSSTKGNIKTTETDINTNNTELDFTAAMSRLWQETFQADFELALVEREKPWDGEKAPELARDIRRYYGDLINESTREKETDRLNRAFYQEQGVLVEYRLTQQNIFAREDLPAAGDNEVFPAQVTDLRRAAGRVRLLMEYDGNMVSPYYVLDKIHSDIELQRQILFPCGILLLCNLYKN